MNSRYVFGEFSVCVGTRTVSEGSKVREAERIVFDVLVYLIAQRHRVVPKQELLRAVWGKVIVTDSAITRAVMKARRLLNDDANEPTILRTVHRVGYRFTADVVELDCASPLAAAAPVALNGSGAQPRIAVFPFQGASGSAAWMQYGLMAVTSGMIEASMPGTVLSVEDVTATTGVVRVANDPLDAEALVKAVGATDIILSAVTHSADATQTTLTYEGHGSRLDGLLGTETGPDAVELCRRIARRVVGRFARAGVSTPMLGREASIASSSHFFVQIRAEAREALQRERWDWARKLLRVALDAAPGDIKLNLDYARTLVSLRDPAVGAVLDRLDRLASLNQDPSLTLSVQLLRSDQKINEGQLAAAEHMLTDCLKMAEEQGNPDAELRATVSFAELLTIEGRGAIARWTMGRASKLALKIGDRLALARLKEIEGRLLAVEGDQTGAAQAFASAAALSERSGMCGNAAFALQHLGVCHLATGQFRLGASCFARALEYACLSGQPMAMALASANASLYRQASDSDVFQGHDIMTHLRRLRARSTPAVQACIDVAEGLTLARQGELARAAHVLDRADTVFSASFSCHVRRHHVRILTCLGEFEEAEALCGELRTSGARVLKSVVEASALHVSALIMRAKGRRDMAREMLSQSTRQWSRPTIQSVDAELDLAWMELDSQELSVAEKRLQSLSHFMPNALSDNYQPAMLVQARLLFESGAHDTAAALQRKYCDIFQCDRGSPAAMLAACYAQGDKGLPPMPLLPSLSELRPGLGLAARLSA